MPQLLYISQGLTPILQVGVADDEGKFFHRWIEPGSYDLKITFLGFETKVIKDIKVTSPTGDINLGNIEMTR